MPMIAPSILSADFTRLGQQVEAVAAAGADWIHIDVMDGHFVPNITMGPLVVEAVRRSTSLPLDVHLMITDPDRYVEAFARAGANLISVQVEACTHLHRTLQRIRETGAQPGVVLNPGTPLSSIQWVIDALDFVLLMSVNPGFGGQAFIPSTLAKIRELRALLSRRGRACLIEVDGGVNNQTAAAVIAAGADVLVAGSAIFKSTDYAATIKMLRQPVDHGGVS